VAARQNLWHVHTIFSRYYCQKFKRARKEVSIMAHERLCLESDGNPSCWRVQKEDNCPALKKGVDLSGSKLCPYSLLTENWDEDQVEDQA